MRSIKATLQEYSIKGISRKKGMSPGTLLHIGKKHTGKTRFTLDLFGAKLFQRAEFDILPRRIMIPKGVIAWLNVTGVHDSAVISEIGERWKLHPLLLEDIMNTTQRPKMDIYENNLFFTLRTFRYNTSDHKITTEQISIVLGKNYVISFQESESDLFGSLHERIKNPKSKLRKLKADYLAYSLIDVAVDGYYGILEKIGDEIDLIEQEAVTSPSKETLENLHRLNSEIIHTRKFVRPLRDLIADLNRMESRFIRDNSRVYLKDVFDHISLIFETLENYREILTGVVDTYLSLSSLKMNEIMKVLTIITTIFIPLTFLVGIYGMNFKHMPELDKPYAYPLLLSFMFFLFLSMMYYFKRKKWI